MLNKLLREQKGAVIVITALVVTALMGFAALAVDIANVYYNKTQLAKAADAAALAGARDLLVDRATAEATAQDYAVNKNGKPGDTVQFDPNDAPYTITVTASRTVPMFFAKVVNWSSQTVSATAKAANKVITGVSGVVPLGVIDQTLVYGQTYTLKYGGGGGTTGNYDALALGGNGASVYCYNLEQGYSGELHVGQSINTQTGNLSGPTSTGIDYRINEDPYATYDTVQKGSPRIVIVPIITPPGNGKSTVTIDGFAAFFLEGVGGSGNQNYVTGKFLKMYDIGETDGTGGTGTDYGLRNIRLIQ